MTDRYDVIPDIHADIARLEATLCALGKEAPLAFLGDFIDGKNEKASGGGEKVPDDAAVLERVRHLVEEEGAMAVMGNHELNAILYHTRGAGGVALRGHSDKNRTQHQSFVQRFGTSTPQARGWIDWFMTLPLWRDLGGLRLVHACWSQPDIDLIAKRRPNGLLQADDLPEIAAEKTDFARAVLNLLKGPEARLPSGHIGFRDTNRHLRHEVRIAWWRSEARTWREAALSVSDPDELPEGKIPQNREITFYPRDATPVLVGHYKMTGQPRLETSNAACLDYPDIACAYRWRGEALLKPECLIGA